MRDKMHHIEGSYAVYPATIIALDITTDDTDAQGYLRHDGTQRGMSCGITTEGEILIYVTTNGNDMIIPDDIDEAISVAATLGDIDGQADPDDSDDMRRRIGEGAERIRQAAGAVAAIYQSEEAQEQVEWYTDKADEIDAETVARDDNALVS